jgi:hypothetical protein
VANFIDLSRLFALVNKALLFGEEVGHSLLGVFLALKNGTEFKVKNFLGIELLVSVFWSDEGVCLDFWWF